MKTTEDTAQRRGVGSLRNFPKSLSPNSGPQLTGKTGDQSTQMLLTVSQIVQFSTHVKGVEQNLNMLVSKDGEVVHSAEGKSHWSFRGWMEAT